MTVRSSYCNSDELRDCNACSVTCFARPSTVAFEKGCSSPVRVGHRLVQAKAQSTGTQRAALLFACVYRPRSCCLRSENDLL